MELKPTKIQVEGVWRNKKGIQYFLFLTLGDMTFAFKLDDKTKDKIISMVEL